MIDMNKLSAVVICLLCGCFFASCSGKISVSAENDGSATVDVSSNLGSAVVQTIQSLNTNESSKNGAIYNAEQIRMQLLKSGLTGVQVSVPKQTELDIRATVENLTKGLPNIPGAITFISGKTGENTLTLTLSPEILQKAVSLLPEDYTPYTDLFMAPVFTGETMTSVEYEDLIASVYGDALKEEIKKSVLTLTLLSPDARKSAVYTIPIVDLLTMETPKFYTVKW